MTTDTLSTRALPRAAYLVAIVALVVFAAAYSYGRDARLKADVAETALAEAENRTFCGSLGFASGTEAHATCVRGLSEIRQRQKMRWEIDAAELF